MKHRMKEIITAILVQLPDVCRDKIIKTKNIIKLKRVKEQRKYVESLSSVYKENKENLDSIKIRNIVEWEKKLKEYILYANDATEFAEKFFNIKIYLKKQVKNREFNSKEPILVCVVKNDLIRIKLILNYYRKLGIKHFAILDDKSTDGTKEYLQEQLDVDLFESDVSYTTLIRQVWINRILDFYGKNKWYLIVDSDELLSYYDMEHCDINKLIDYLEKNNIYRMRTILLDMYADNSRLNEENDTLENIEKKYSYFDVDNIFNIKNIKFICLAGGVRCRVFSETKNEFKPYLTKYPLIKYTEEDIVCNSHYAFPYYKNFKTECLGVLRHYKFMNGDMIKYKERMEKGNFEKGSKQYKRYMEMYSKEGKFTFFYDKSEQWSDSKSLEKLPFVKKVGR